MPQATRGEIISALKKGVRTAATPGEARVVPLGCEPVDMALSGGGLGLGNLHEITGEAATGFVAALLGRLQGQVLWCAGRHFARPLYPPGLARFGLDPDRLVLARPRDKRDALWVAEEAMKSGALTAVVLEADFTVPLSASRRLQLSVEASWCLGLLLYRGEEAKISGATAARTRWKISPCPAPPHTQGPCWRLDLTRNKGGPAGQWEVSWHDTSHRFDLVPEIADRPAGTQDAA